MFVSTFEILTKKIAPGNSPSARKVVQAYFLTISNLESNSVEIALDFTAITPELSSAVISIFDVADINEFQPLIPNPSDSKKMRRVVNIPAHDTGLFILQPNIIQQPDLDNLEIRGFVEIAKGPFFNPALSTANLLLSAQSRGTFLPANFDPNNPGGIDIGNLDFDQIAYDLPIAEGKAMVAV
ncbi:hypothetical protein [Leptolyngbya sp. FACHB-261]|uniref:hypothetical protein n=1 Tax=Leptolyngbya sp. FACHB-261 TaxID=2692806 RepID=UPI00168623C9|nr:hypothetical protein [Leptolyngbya sp. FACHB-261]MBD2099344.1 hypothetical protein [Leptolyngbya sp. FACHB-261]